MNGCADLNEVYVSYVGHEVQAFKQSGSQCAEKLIAFID
jgi:hypothetical protein